MHLRPAGLVVHRLAWLLLLVYGAQARLWLRSVSTPLARDCSDAALFTPQRCCRALERLQIGVIDLRAAAEGQERAAELAGLHAGEQGAAEFGSMEPRLVSHLGPIEGLWHWAPDVRTLRDIPKINPRFKGTVHMSNMTNSIKLIPFLALLYGASTGMVQHMYTVHRNGLQQRYPSLYKIAIQELSGWEGTSIGGYWNATSLIVTVTRNGDMGSYETAIPRSHTFPDSFSWAAAYAHWMPFEVAESLVNWVCRAFCHMSENSTGIVCCEATPVHRTVTYSAAFQSLFHPEHPVSAAVHEAIVDAFRKSCAAQQSMLSAEVHLYHLKRSQTHAIRSFDQRFDLLDFAIRLTPATGLICEFGVFSGESLNHIARSLPNRVVNGFDSFVGLPGGWAGYSEGDFSMNGTLPSTEANVRLWPGWFNATIERSLATSDPRHEQLGIALAHIDCDLHSSTKDVLEAIGPRLQRGTLILFDEYFGHFRWQDAEARAWREFAHSRAIPHKFIGHTPYAMLVQLV